MVHLNQNMTKPTKWSVCPAKSQISLGIYPVWSESSLSSWRNLGSLATHWVHSEKTLIRLGWSESTLSAYHFVGFVMLLLIYQVAKCILNIKQNVLVKFCFSSKCKYTRVGLNNVIFWTTNFRFKIHIHKLFKAKWVAAWQNQQNDLCAQWRLQSV